MFKRELKVNLKGFIIWTCILILMFSIVSMIYPYILTDEMIMSLDEMLKMFPEAMLKAFNMDISSINSAYGWFKSEGLIFIILIGSFYSSMLGATILLKEENDKTIEYLSELPIRRSTILTNKIKASIFYIILMMFILGIFNMLFFSSSKGFVFKEYILLSFSPLLVIVPLFSICLFVSTFFRKTRSTIGISVLSVFFFYIISIISELSSNAELFKYFTIFTLANIRNIILNSKISVWCIIVSIIITAIFIALTYIKYNKKEIL